MLQWRDEVVSGYVVLYVKMFLISTVCKIDFSTQVVLQIAFNCLYYVFSVYFLGRFCIVVLMVVGVKIVYDVWSCLPKSFKFVANNSTVVCYVVVKKGKPVWFFELDF